VTPKGAKINKFAATVGKAAAKVLSKEDNITDGGNGDAAQTQDG
jgi:hypothetical protein